MSEQFSDATADKLTGALGLVASVAYGYTALNIEDSLLADAVGAGGVPFSVACVMFLAALFLSLKAWFKPQDKTRVEPQAEVSEGSAHPHAMALALLLILALYVLVLPYLGYVVSIGILVVCSAWLGGARQKRSLIGSALLAGPVLWLIFDWALSIGLPMGFWSALGK
jgi:hypothetical protein